jgi:hypothetical protein
MTEDASFKIKGLETLLNDNQKARNELLHKQELYPFVMRLLNESDKGNELYPFLVRVLEENKELVRRLSDCQKAYGIMEIREVDNRRRTNELYAEREKLEAANNFLKKENEALKAKAAKAKKGKTK